MKSELGLKKAKRERLSKKDRALLDAETTFAEKYLCAHVKMSGPLEHIEDGKTEVLVRLPWSSLVRLMRDYGINTVVRLSEGKAGESQ